MNPPTKLDEFYAADYTSFQVKPFNLVRRMRTSAYAWFPWLVQFDPKRIDGELRSTLRLGLSKSARILDVGSGGGRLVEQIRYLGYRNAEGIDPYLETDTPILKRADLRRWDGRDYDAILLHHVIEHDADPVELLVAARQRLAPNGVVLIRTPVLDSWCAKTFGAKWKQYDAPRHLIVHTRKSLGVAVSRARLTIRAMYDDGFLQMARLHDPTITRAFVRDLNTQCRGDQVCAVLTPP